MFPNKLEALEYINEMRDYVHNHFKDPLIRLRFLLADRDISIALDTLGDHYASNKAKYIAEMTEN